MFARHAGPLVSICITSFNYGRYVRDAIESALAQTYAHIEVVVSDNASTDETHAVLASFAFDERVRVYINDTNVGLCKNHNLAIERARGEYITVLSADDILFPHHVEVLLRRMLDRHDPVSIVYGEGMLLDERLNPIRALHSPGSLTIPHSGRDDFGNIIFNYHHFFPAKLIKRNVYDRLGSFDERMISLIDIEMAARMEEHDIPTAFVPEFLAGLRNHDGNNSKQARNDTNIWIGDKLTMTERALDERHAWRIEGYEEFILYMIDFELERLKNEGAQALSDRHAARLDRIRKTFAERRAQQPSWPQQEPELSVVLLTEGYLTALTTSLDALIAQHVERLEICIVQSSGCDVSPWIARLPYAHKVRVVQVRACTTPAQALRYGLDLARGEYVTYLFEGQRIEDRFYSDAIKICRDTGAKALLLPKHSIDDSLPGIMLPELHPQQFPDAATRARARGAENMLSLCHLFHRRALLRGASIHYAHMVEQDEHTFVQSIIASFPSLTLAQA